ncbi:MAG: SpoIVB peptidase S55 domain-containing protein [bacterium]
MKKRFVMIAAAVILSLASCAAARSLEIMPVRDVQPGMKGVGYSVFKGTKPEPFNAEIIAVIPKFETGNSLILARLTGANLEFSGVIAGMSGSPVYIDGKLIGAVAYAWYYAKEAVAGIQPIENMTKLWDEPSVAPKNSAVGDKSRQPFSYANSRSLNAVEKTSKSASVAAVHTATSAFGDVELTPIMTPLLLSNMNPEAAAFLKEHLAKYNLLPIQAGGGASELEKEGMNDLCPGCVIGSPLITGDFTATAIGTVTAREGDKLLAFGHPFFNSGPTMIPMSGGEIFHVMSVVTNSFKMGAPGKVIGAITDDRTSAIAGQIGLKTNYFPVSIEVVDADANRSKVFNVQIAQLREIAPYLLYSVIFKAVNKAAGLPDTNVSVRAAIDGEIEGYDKPFHFEDMFVQPPNSINSDPMAYLFDLLDNPFREIRLKNVKVKLTINRARDDLNIEDVTLANAAFHPGDRVRAFVSLKSYNEIETRRAIEFRIPKNAQPGIVTLEFGGGGSQSGMPSAVPPDNFDQLFDMLNKWTPQNVITVRFTYPDKSVGIGGRELQDLPLSVGNTYTQGAFPQQALFGRYGRAVLKTDNVIYGGATAQITIDKEFQP